MVNALFRVRVLSDAMEARRLRLLFEQTVISGFMGVFIACVLVYILSDSTPGFGLPLWAGIQVIIIVARGSTAAMIKKALDQGKTNFRFYHFVYFLFMILSGIYWGLGGYLFFPAVDNIELFVTFITIYTAISAANMTSMAPSLPCYLAFMIPTLTAISIRLYELDYQVLSNSILTYLVFLLAVSAKLNQVVLHALSLDIENEKLVRSVTEEKEIAEQANIEKSRFLTAASHDLRQPLNSMGLFLYALKTRIKTVEDPKPASILEQLDHSYSALKNLFDSLMEISHLDAGTLQAEIKCCRLDLIVKPLVHELQEEAFAKGLEFNHSGSGCYVNTDPILLSRILRNLINNAIKYTNEGKIDVLETLKDGFVEINIVDTGIGIPKQEFNNIFNEYHQLANKRRDRRQGIGLGLALVKKMCWVLDTEISLTSQLNKGSVFSLSLPVADPDNELSEQSDQENISISGVKLLIIDDEPDILEAMELLFRSWGCRVDCAENYDQALLLAKQNKPDIILCDYRLQDNLTGVDAMEMLGKALQNQVPAIIITGDTDPELLKLIKSKGYMMLAKPVQPLTLQEKVGHLIDLAENGESM